MDVDIPALVVEFSLQPSILCEYLVHLVWKRHGLFKALQLSFLFTQLCEWQQTLLPQGVRRIKPSLLRQVTNG